MINENKLIRELGKSNLHHASNSREEVLLDRIIRIVKDQPKVGEWIEVEEELPEENEYVDITVLYKDEGIECQYDTDIARYYCKMWIDGHGMPIIGNVIAWKPRPEPYRKENK